MKLKQTIALVLTLLMLLPCFFLGASAEESLVNENGYVCTKETMKSSTGMSHTYVYTFDAKGNLLTANEVSRDGKKLDYQSSKACSYDLKGNKTGEIYVFDNADHDFEKYIVSFTYDKHGRVTKEVYARQKPESTERYTRTYTYDKNGNLVKDVTSNKNTDDTGSYSSKCSIAMTYDKKNRLTKKAEVWTSAGSDPDKTVTAFKYDKAGNCVKEVMTKSAYGTVEKTVTVNTFDKKGNKTKAVTAMKNSMGDAKKETVIFTYDKAGRLVKSVASGKDSYGISEKTVETCAYNAGGYVTKRTFSTKNSEGYFRTMLETMAYDDAGRVIKMAQTDTDESGTEKNTEANTFDANGALVKYVGTHHGADGESSKMTGRFTNDKHGNATKAVWTYKNSEGSSKEVYTYEYQKVAA